MPGVEGTMREFKHGTLHSGSKNGPIVKSRKQAIAIALNDNPVQRRKKKQRAEAEKMVREHMRSKK